MNFFFFIKVFYGKRFKLIKNSPLVVTNEWQYQAILCAKTCASSRLIFVQMLDHIPHTDKAFHQYENVHVVANRISLQIVYCNIHTYTIMQ